MHIIKTALVWLYRRLNPFYRGLQLKFLLALGRSFSSVIFESLPVRIKIYKSEGYFEGVSAFQEALGEWFHNEQTILELPLLVGEAISPTWTDKHATSVDRTIQSQFFLTRPFRLVYSDLTTDVQNKVFPYRLKTRSKDAEVERTIDPEKFSDEAFQGMYEELSHIAHVLLWVQAVCVCSGDVAIRCTDEINGIFWEFFLLNGKLAIRRLSNLPSRVYLRVEFVEGP